MYGKLGHGSELGHPSPQQVQSLLGYKVEMVACGSRHTVALLATGEVCVCVCVCVCVYFLVL